MIPKSTDRIFTNPALFIKSNRFGEWKYLIQDFSQTLPDEEHFVAIRTTYAKPLTRWQKSKRKRAGITGDNNIWPLMCKSCIWSRRYYLQSINGPVAKHHCENETNLAAVSPLTIPTVLLRKWLPKSLIAPGIWLRYSSHFYILARARTVCTDDNSKREWSSIAWFQRWVGYSNRTWYTFHSLFALFSVWLLQKTASFYLCFMPCRNLY